MTPPLTSTSPRSVSFSSGLTGRVSMPRAMIGEVWVHPENQSAIFGDPGQAQGGQRAAEGAQLLGDLGHGAIGDDAGDGEAHRSQELASAHGGHSSEWIVVRRPRRALRGRLLCPGRGLMHPEQAGNE
jgi:hypothetical protein